MGDTIDNATKNVNFNPMQSGVLKNATGGRWGGNDNGSPQQQSPSMGTDFSQLGQQSAADKQLGQQIVQGNADRAQQDALTQQNQAATDALDAKNLASNQAYATAQNAGAGEDAFNKARNAARQQKGTSLFGAWG